MWFRWNGQRFKRLKTRSCMARSFDENWESRSESRETEWAKGEPKLENARRPKGISRNHETAVHKFIPMPQAMKIPDAKSALDEEWKKLETTPVWNLEKKSRARRRLFFKHKETTRKSTLPHWWTCVTSKNADLNPNLQMYKGRVVLRERHCKRRLWSARIIFLNKACLRAKLTAAK